MSEAREIDKLLDELSVEFKLEEKEIDKEKIEEIKQKILKLTLDGERAIGLWTEGAEFRSSIF